MTTRNVPLIRQQSELQLENYLLRPTRDCPNLLCQSSSFSAGPKPNIAILSPRPNRASKNVVTTKTCDVILGWILFFNIPSEYQLDDPRRQPPGYHDDEQENRTILISLRSHPTSHTYWATTNWFTDPWRHLRHRKTCLTFFTNRKYPISAHLFS